jgi:hypothetical protein
MVHSVVDALRCLLLSIWHLGSIRLEHERHTHAVSKLWRVRLQNCPAGAVYDRVELGITGKRLHQPW